jgi:3-methyladenine DNA glycosylase AlkD
MKPAVHPGQSDAIARLQHALAGAASERTRVWWQNYLRGEIPFRGVGIPAIRDILAEWRTTTGVAGWPVRRQLEIALALFAEAAAEDKLAGVLLLQNYLRTAFDWRELLPRYAELYERNFIFDWNTCDWFCVRVLGPTLQEQGMPFARALARWRSAPQLWQARSAAVPVVAVASDTSYHPTVATIGATLLRRDERFAKTAVGWIMREISRHDPAFVRGFLRTNLPRLTPESLRNATKYFTATARARLLAELKHPRRSLARGDRHARVPSHSTQRA